MKNFFSKLFVIFLLFFLVGFPFFSCTIITAQEDSGTPSWQVVDFISPTMENVEWIEKGNYSVPPTWISDGRWYEAHMRQSLVGSSSIFASLSESLNWTAVNEGFSEPFSSFDEFASQLTEDPSWWLKYSWAIDTKWHGVPLNSTIVRTEYDPETSKAEIFIWCRITNIPEYILGENRLETLLTGFDLTPVFIGKLETLQWYSDYTADGRSYYIYFKAPSNLMEQNKDTYSVTFDISPLYQGKTYDVEQKIQVSMPPNTEILNTIPSVMSTRTANIATFTIHRGNQYPAAFSVTSAPPIKDTAQVFLENAVRWITEPSAWLAIVSLAVIGYTAFRGGQLWNRRKTYYRLYRSMVSIYEHYAPDYAKFQGEIDNLSASFLKCFIDDKITDEQFERLLHARDNLTDKAKNLPPPPPQQSSM